MTRSEILKAAKPILFGTEMVRAIQDGRNTVTRRPVKPKSPKACGFYVVRDSKGNFMDVYDYDENEAMFESPQARLHIGDILYVRETWCKGRIVGSKQYLYVSQGEMSDIIFKEECLRNHIGVDDVVWRPSIHMPKEAARIFLRVTDVRVERLQDISDKDFIREGIEPYIHIDGSFNREATQTAYVGIWNSTVKKSNLSKYGWDANPWVWVIEFERVEVE